MALLAQRVLTVTDTDILPFLTEAQVVALTLWGEARSEPAGRFAVGCVIRNRARTRKQTMRAVCLAKAQFSCWSDAGGQANHESLMRIASTLPIPADPILRECLWIADGLISGALLDRVQGAGHYFTTDLYHDNPPAWVQSMKVVAVVGNHTFLKG